MHQARPLTTPASCAMVSVVTTLRNLLMMGLWSTATGCDPASPEPLKHLPHPGGDSAAPQDTGSDDTGQDSPSPQDTGTPDTGSGPSDTGTDDTGTDDTGELPGCDAPLVLAGSAFVAPSAEWWGELMSTLLCGGPVTDGEVLRVGLFHESPPAGPTAAILGDLEAVLLASGAAEVESYMVSGAEDADAITSAVDSLDAAVLVPDSAGEAYDAWNDTALEAALTRLHVERGGGIAGLGEGAMLLAGSSLAGGQDYLSTHVMIDGHTTELADLSDGGSALHDDFLPWVPDATVDVQFTSLGRLVRLVGALARRVDEAPDTRAWGIGLDQNSALIIQDGTATVTGPGTVSVIRPGPDSELSRARWQPLTWTDLDMDRLTAGWQFDLTTGTVATTVPPDGSEAVEPLDVAPIISTEDWHVSGHLPDEEAGFGVVVQRTASTYATATGTAEVTMPTVLGMLDADFHDAQALNHEALYRALYDHLGHIGVLVTYQGRLEHDATAPGILRFTWNTPVPSRVDPEMLLERWEPSHVVVDTLSVRWRSLSEATSPHSSAIHPAGLIGMKLHLLAGSDSGGWIYDLSTRRPSGP